MTAGDPRLTIWAMVLNRTPGLCWLEVIRSEKYFVLDFVIFSACYKVNDKDALFSPYWATNQLYLSKFTAGSDSDHPVIILGRGMWSSDSDEYVTDEIFPRLCYVEMWKFSYQTQVKIWHIGYQFSVQNNRKKPSIWLSQSSWLIF